ncbi:hypothetical protein [Leucobacter sp. cx-169]|uniref:hypothetical protein n=1 Tax=Leucobacter sp. cx-169 TaxID=2770549 RepID=UPI00165DB6C5|nr:hypothetical protein [Leucobacter sp. cx-169]MBC9927193.1 hypothetical protein [Leucobacter sp. cx-169]
MTATLTPPAVVQLADGDRLSIELPRFRGGVIAHDFTVVTTEGLARRRGDDPSVWVERARHLGHELHGAFNEGVTITAHQQEVVARTEVALGQTVELEGVTYTIAAAPNHNIQFVPVVDTEEEV